MRFRQASAEDLAPIVSLLERSELPTDDCRERIDGFVLLEDGENIIATGGLELHGKEGLIRSIVVVPDRRGTGIGRCVCAKLEKRAGAAGIERLFLLTDNAVPYFLGLGYQLLRRADTPPEIRATKQFSSLCPGSAKVMFRRVESTPAGGTC